MPDSIEQSQNQVYHGNIDQVVNALVALVGTDITSEQMAALLINEKVAGNIDLQDKLHDYLMEHGDDVKTEEQLQDVIRKIM